MVQVDDCQPSPTDDATLSAQPYCYYRSTKMSPYPASDLLYTTTNWLIMCNSGAKSKTLMILLGFEIII